jgi:hypothetical protein
MKEPNKSFNLLPGELGLVFVGNLEPLQLAQLLVLDCLDLPSLVLQFLSNHLSFLQIIQALLFLHLLVLQDLSANSSCMLLKHTFLFHFNSSFLFLNLLLLIQNSDEFISLLFGLFSQSRLLLIELSLPCFLQILQNLLSILHLPSFFVSSLSLALLKGSLRSQSIDFALSILSLFLQISESLNFSFLFFLDSSFLLHSLLFSQSLLSVVLHYFLVHVLFLLLFRVFNVDCPFISIFNFDYELLGSLLLDLLLFVFLQFELFDLSEHLVHFLLPQLLFLNSFNFSLFDLVNND